MRQVLIAAAVTLVGLTAPASVFAQDAVTASEVSPDSIRVSREIVAAIYPPETREDTLIEMAQSIGAQVANSGSLASIEDEGAKAIVENGLAQALADMRPLMAKHIPILMEATAVSYADTFMLGELMAIRDFARTPAGSVFFRDSPTLVSHPALTSANAPYFAELQVFARNMQTQLVADLQDYFMQKSESAADPT